MLIRATFAALCGVTLFAADAAAFEGRYGRSGADFRQSVVITRQGDGIYKVLLTVQSRLCTGELEAIGEVVGGNLVAEVTAQDDECKVTIARRGSGISVRESKCLNWHGAACEFDGQLQPR